MVLIVPSADDVPSSSPQATNAAPITVTAMVPLPRSVGSHSRWRGAVGAGGPSGDRRSAPIGLRSAAMDVTDKAAIVTGASSGVGAATARRLAEPRVLGGDQLCVVGRQGRGRRRGLSCSRSMRSPGRRRRRWRAARGSGRGCIDFDGSMCSLNAGTTEFVPHHDLAGMESAAWDRILGVNLKGPFLYTSSSRSPQGRRRGRGRHDLERRRARRHGLVDRACPRRRRAWTTSR